MKFERSFIDDLDVKLDSVIEPNDFTHGLPNECYTNPLLAEFERDSVLANTWVAIGFASDVPKPGHVSPIDFMGLPLLLVRNKDDAIRVFHNVCSHRGMKLVDQACERRAVIRCPYHSWSYDLDGHLITTPLIGGIGQNQCDGFDSSRHGLKSVRFAVWMDTVFVNISATAEAFSTYIAPLERRWAPFWGNNGQEKFSPAESGSKLELEVKCNWKLAVENYCEAYHLPWIHPTLNQYSPLEQHFGISDDIAMSGQGTHHYDLTPTNGVRLPTVANWPSDRIRHAEYLSLFPNTLLGIQADHAFVIALIPKQADSTRERLQIMYAIDAATDDRYAASRAAVLNSWDTVFREDVFAVEGLQKGRASPAFEGGVLTPVQDGPTRSFHTWTAHRFKTALQQARS